MCRLFVLASFFNLVFIGCAPSFSEQSSLENKGLFLSENQAADIELQQIRISGVLHIIYGDPPPDSNGKPRMKFIIKDKQGQNWVLLFDKMEDRLISNMRSLNNKQVVVEGMSISEDASKLISVERLRAE